MVGPYARPAGQYDGPALSLYPFHYTQAWFQSIRADLMAPKVLEITDPMLLSSVPVQLKLPLTIVSIIDFGVVHNGMPYI